VIIKGGSRAAPGQLAYHLQRVDTNERVRIIELQSAAATLRDAFRDCQTLSEGTRGELGLYHANIDPHSQYPMTPKQWKRAVDVLEKELGFEGQPRAVVMHDKEGRQHIHVVWARTDIETMTLRSDSQNYLAHELASAQLEREFGHEHVPGKHAKRDREKQPEFPRAEANHAEWQQAERTGIDAAERKRQITALRAASDDAQAFKNALEDAGYILAKGDKRGLVLVDAEGEVFSLSRYVTDLKPKDLKAFMEPIPVSALPSADEAKALHERKQAVGKAEGLPEGDKRGVETSKFLPPQPAEAETPVPALLEGPRPAFGPGTPVNVLKQWSDGAQAFKSALEEAGYTLARGKPGYIVIDEHGEIAALSKLLKQSRIRVDAFMSPIPIDSLPTVEEVFQARKRGVLPGETSRKIETVPEPPKDTYTQALELATQKRFQEEQEKLAQLHQHQLRLKEVELDRAIAARLDEMKAKHEQEIQTFRDTRSKERTGLKGFLDAMLSRLNPTLAAEKAQARAKEQQDFFRRLGKERADLQTLQQQNKQLEIDAVIERQAREMRELKTKTEQDLARHIREHQQAEIIRQQTKEQRERDRGLDPPRVR